jgi:hypothetical protein
MDFLSLFPGDSAEISIPVPDRNNRGFPKTSVFGKATLKFAVLQGCYKAKSLKNRKSLQAQHTQEYFLRTS